MKEPLRLVTAACGSSAFSLAGDGAAPMRGKLLQAVGSGDYLRGAGSGTGGESRGTAAPQRCRQFTAAQASLL